MGESVTEDGEERTANERIVLCFPLSILRPKTYSDVDTE